MSAFVHDKLVSVKAAETEVLRKKAEYVYETCKAIVETSAEDRDVECEEFIDDIYEMALKINGDN